MKLASYLSNMFHYIYTFAFLLASVLPMQSSAQDSLFQISFKKAIELSELLTDNGRSAIVMNTLQWDGISGKALVKVDSVKRRRYNVIEFQIDKVSEYPFTMLLSGDGNQNIGVDAKDKDIASTSIEFLIQAGVIEEKSGRTLIKKISKSNH